MQALGFDTCDLAANAQDAFLRAMENLPDIVLMNVDLKGGREGIEAARWLREVGACRSSSSLHKPPIPSSVFTNRCQMPR